MTAIKFLAGNALALPFSDETFDSVTIAFGIRNIGDKLHALKEFRRVLKNSGKLILVNMTQGEGWGSKIYDLIYDVSPELLGGCRGVSLSEKLQKNGFKVATREVVQQMLFPSEVILAYK